MVNTKRLLALAMALVMAFSFASLSFAASYSDDGTAYTGEQGTGGNTLTLYSDTADSIKCLAVTTEKITNKITTLYDSAAVITFDFAMSAGMKNFDEAAFKDKNMSKINIFNEAGSEAVATYSAGTLDFVSYTAASETGKYNGVAYITISIDAATLAADTVYALTFGKDIQGNNASKTIGADVEFLFKTAAVEDEGNFFDTIIANVKGIIEKIINFIKGLFASISL